ncbi:M16 family metallopeptidase [Clostridium algidicarnis]|uniref:M16 family metallopeptidase n=1 Tax=Clostridium algidicarnis TaxID=37659 RepID=UPI001C0BF8E3|nr:pitrilysin family protein [Clostridium algidicarnis]MBU3195314.1 insulinase family protein [Clostridium algidicarnis]MBU3208273.1 insulinase family protein [Clostridium algidicarnis]MBU3227495.1 insulinase family protein [Clostridium algidicarnis]MBU3251098.1 insulinase family protein [Clostridium algidicarnis]
MKKPFFDAKDTVLQNGLRVITIKKDTQIMSIQVGVKIGSMYETIEEKGISHFIEHMLFKGTKFRDNETLNNDLEFLGGEYNAYTDYKSTVYSISALEEEITNSLDLLSDMVMNSTFPLDEIERERGVILSEIKGSLDDVENLSFKKLNEIAFDNSPLKWEVSGDEKNINSFNRQDLIDFYNKFYTPKNAIIVMVSSLPHEEALEKIDNKFSTWEGTNVEKKDILVENNKPIVKTTIKKDLEQSSIAYLYTFHDLPKKKELSLKILNHKLGESSNSILFRELREKLGLAYDAYTDLDMTSKIKTMCIYTSVSEENIDKAITTIDKCIEDIKNKRIKINDNTVKLMSKVHKTAVVSTIEDSMDLGSYVLFQALEEDNIQRYLEDMDALEKINKESIYEVANIVLKNPTIHILKNEKE